MFKNREIKTFELEDLVGRKIDIRSFTEGSTELLCAKDMETGDFFVLKETIHPQCSDKNT